MRNTNKTLVRKSEGLKLLGRPRNRYEDNIKMDLKEIGYGLGSSGSGQTPVAVPC
jgi:hypothetical protein